MNALELDIDTSSHSLVERLALLALRIQKRLTSDSCKKTHGLAHEFRSNPVLTFVEKALNLLYKRGIHDHGCHLCH